MSRDKLLVVGPHFHHLQLVTLRVVCDKNYVNSCGPSIVRYNNIKRFGARAQVGVSPTSVLCGALMNYGSQIVGQACRHNKIDM